MSSSFREKFCLKTNRWRMIEEDSKWPLWIPCLIKYTCINTLKWVCAHMCAYTYIHTYTHTHRERERERERETETETEGERSLKRKEKCIILEEVLYLTIRYIFLVRLASWE